MSNSSVPRFTRDKPSCDNGGEGSDRGGCDSNQLATGNDCSCGGTVTNVFDARVVKHGNKIGTSFAAQTDPNDRFDVFQFTTHGLFARARVCWSLIQSAVGVAFTGKAVWVRKSDRRIVIKH